ncbi:MAG: rod shape-determining protein MreD [Bacteroidia bacterium]|nr:rod shape-determining protein MreD [Bacteroidia bacterium]
MITRDWIRLVASSIVVLAVQILIINNLNLNQYMFPQLYIILLLSLPINLKHYVGYLIAFIMGFVVDSFSYTPGLQSFTAVFVMFLRYSYFNNLVDKEWLSSGIRPSFSNADSGWYLAYVSIFTFVFHFVLLILENFSFVNFGGTMLKILYSSSLAILLILLFQFTFNRETVNDE